MMKRTVTARLDSRIDSLAADGHSSATALLPTALAILRAAMPLGPDVLRRTAVAVCLAQPSMASFWNAAAAAVAAPEALDRFEARTVRGLKTLRVEALRTLLPASAGTKPPRFLTC